MLESSMILNLRYSFTLYFKWIFPKSSSIQLIKLIVMTILSLFWYHSDAFWSWNAIQSNKILITILSLNIDGKVTQDLVIF